MAPPSDASSAAVANEYRARIEVILTPKTKS
jgi:hypothetical protein